MPKLLLVVALAVAACGGSAPATTAPGTPGSIATLAPATPTSTPAPTPRATPGVAWAVHIVKALDKLAIGGRSDDALLSWASDESDWITSAGPKGPDGGPFASYLQGVIDMLQAIVDAKPTAAAVEALLSQRATYAAMVPGLVDADPPGRKVEIVEFGFTYYGGSTKYVQYGIVLRNPNEGGWIATDVSVNITFFGDDGSVVGSDDDSIDVIPPGNPGEKQGRSTAIGDVAFIDGKAVKMTVTVTSELSEAETTSFGHAEFSKVKTTSDSYGTTTRGLVGSTFVEALDYVYIVAIYRNSAGKIVGGDNDLVDKLPNDGTVSFEISTLGRIPNVAKTEMYANP